LSCHRVKLGYPRKLSVGSKYSAELTEVVSPNVLVVHPVPKASIANKIMPGLLKKIRKNRAFMTEFNYQPEIFISGLLVN
jgi:hypothetical protein